MTESRRPTRVVPAGVVAVLVVLLGWFGASAAYAADPPQLSMTVDDGEPASEAKAESDYTITVANLGAKKIKDLLVTLRVPDGATITSAEDDASIKKGVATWTVDIGAGKSVELAAAVGVPAKLSPELLRFAVIACGATSAKEAPVVCASDSNLLPAGARAEQEQRDLAPAAGAAARPGWLLPAAIGAALLVMAAAAGAFLVRDRRRRRRRRARQQARSQGARSTDGASDQDHELTHLRG